MLAYAILSNRISSAKNYFSNMGKRSFYEDEELVTTKPGFNAEINSELKEKESAHGNISFIDGMGVRTTPYLEQHFNALRLYVHDKLSVVGAELATQKSALNNEYNYLKSKVDEVVVDPVLPDIMNVVFPLLVTSVLVSRRSLPVRFAVSTFVAGASVKYYMPRTYEATKSKLLAWEQHNLPEVYNQQTELSATFADYIKEASKLSEQAHQDLLQQVHVARKWVQEVFDDE